MPGHPGDARVKPFYVAASLIVLSGTGTMRAGDAKCMGDGVFIQIQKPGRRGGSAERAIDAGRVKATFRNPSYRQSEADSKNHLRSDRHRSQEISTARAKLFADGDSRRNNHTADVSAARSAVIIQLESMTERTVDQSRVLDRRSMLGSKHTRIAGNIHFLDIFEHLAVPRQHRAGERHA